MCVGYASLLLVTNFLPALFRNLGGYNTNVCTIGVWSLSV